MTIRELGLRECRRVLNHDDPIEEGLFCGGFGMGAKCEAVQDLVKALEHIKNVEKNPATIHSYHLALNALEGWRKANE